MTHSIASSIKKEILISLMNNTSRIHDWQPKLYTRTFTHSRILIKAFNKKVQVTVREYIFAKNNHFKFVNKYQTQEPVTIKIDILRVF